MRNRRRRGAAQVAALAAGLLAVTSCGSGASGTAPTSAPTPAAVSVVASTDVYGAVVAAVGGDRVQVTSIINDPAADPHSYESTPADAAKLGAAKVVVFNGGGYDEFMTKLLDAAATKPKTIDVVALSGIDPATGAGAEHVWYSLNTIKKLAAQLVTDLGAVDPAGSTRYAANLTAFNSKIDGLQVKVDSIKLAHAGGRVAVTEPVPGYLLEAAGLTDVTPKEFVAAVEAETDPPAAAVSAMLKLFQPPDPVRAVVLNAQTETPATKQVEQAATTGNIAVLQMTETLPQGTNDYSTWMGQQIDSLAAALNPR